MLHSHDSSEEESSTRCLLPGDFILFLFLLHDFSCLCGKWSSWFPGDGNSFLTLWSIVFNSDRRLLLVCMPFFLNSAAELTVVEPSWRVLLCSLLADVCTIFNRLLSKSSMLSLSLACEASCKGWGSFSFSAILFVLILEVLQIFERVTVNKCTCKCMWTRAHTRTHAHTHMHTHTHTHTNTP